MKTMKKLISFLIAASVIIGLVNCTNKGGSQPSDLSTSSRDSLSTGFSEVTGYGTNPGNIKMFAYIPANMPANAPLVLALHGCTQSATAYHQLSGWSELAEKYKFYVIYAEQNSKNNQNACFNWGGDPNSGSTQDMDPAGTKRDGDENLSLKQMVEFLKTKYTIDSKRVFVTGLSAGGYMTALMLAVYPDIFSAGAVMAGGPYLCDRTDAGKLDSNEAYKCTSPGKDKTPEYWASMVNYSGYAKPADVKWPKLQIWHGTSDYIVKDLNKTELKEQFAALHGISQSPSETTTLKGYPYELYKNSLGESVIEVITIPSMGHGTPVDPGTAEDQGGKAGAYMLDTNVHSSYYAAKFFGLFGQPAPISGDPTVTILSTGGEVAPGELIIRFTATDDKGIATAQLIENGSTALTASRVSGDAISGTYEVKVTKAVGTYTYKAKVTDTEGKSVETAAITFSVKDVPTPVTDNWTAEDGSFSGSGTVPSAIFHAPAGISKAADASMVVYLHGCLESDTIGRDNTEWNKLADKYKFFVLYVKSTGTNQCFDWYSSTSQSGSGDTAAIMSLIGKMKTKYSSGNSAATTKIKNIYVAGLSAGGAMTVQLLSLYPNEFKGGAAMSAMPYKGFTGAATSTLSYMSGGDKNTPAVWASKMPSNPGTYPPLLEIHGATDSTVAFSFQNGVMEQWTQVQGADQTADSNRFLTTASAIKGHAYKEYWSADNSRLIVATLAINGMGHSITVDPGSAEDQGGKTASYSVDKDLYCAYWATKFFGLTAPADVSPMISIISPVNGSTQTGSFTVSANASDDKGVSKVEFYVNGVLKVSDSAVPYEFTVNAAEYSNGTLSVSAKVYDTINQTAQSSISVTLAKPVEEPSVLITEPVNNYKTKASTLTVKANAADNKAVTKVEFYINNVLNTTVASAPYESVLDISSYSDGALAVKAIAYDADGYTSSHEVTVNVDKTLPVVSFDKLGGTYDTGTKVSFTSGEAVNFYYTTDGTEPSIASATGTSYTFNAQGTYTLKVLAIDGAGNMSAVKSDSYTLIVSDAAIPTVVISSPVEKYGSPAQVTGSINLTGTAADDKAVAKVEIKVYAYKYTYIGETPTLTNTYTANGTTSWTYTLSGLTKYKYYKIEAQSTDTAGKVSTVSFVRVYQM